MPFTPSHAVVALPFVRTQLVPAAIAIGSMTPDMPLFVRGLPLDYGRTHDLPWLPATMMLALVLLLVWRCILRPATRNLSPRWLAVRLPAEWDSGAAAGFRETFFVTVQNGRQRVRGVGLLMLAFSLGLGVLSHVVWDLFTHEGRVGVNAIPALDQQWGPLLGYKWLQHGSSAVGLAIIAIWMLLWLRRADVSPTPALMSSWVRWTWWLSLPAILLIAWIAGLHQWGPLTTDFTVAHLAYRVLPPACAIWGVGTLVLAILVQSWQGNRARESKTAG
ncbi:DUF4184 family protein [Microbacterium sp. NPDC076911]|uniref:DUF4184 family protein n=1 Tax=Microbacterium sp. NPDC076911 TaxID=3154958 RepID=UPI003424150A